MTTAHSLLPLLPGLLNESTTFKTGAKMLVSVSRPNHGETGCGRLVLANRRLVLLRLLNPNASKYASYDLICSTLCRELLLLLVGATSYASSNYETMCHGQSWTRHESQAHKWLRCLYGALDRLAGCNLVRVVMQFLRDGPLRRRKEAGAPVATLRKWMSIIVRLRLDHGVGSKTVLLLI